jgi:hypothetical protein
MISYGPPPTTTTPSVNVATYNFTPAPPVKSTFRPGDSITFQFQPSTGLSLPTVATLMTAYKAKNANPDNSPFALHKGAIDILVTPKLTIGKYAGKWGVAALFTATTADDSYFFFLPDPEIIVSPE